MIKPMCKICKKELDDYGALLFSPPENDEKVDKIHICKNCYNQIMTEQKFSTNKNSGKFS